MKTLSLSFAMMFFITSVYAQETYNFTVPELTEADMPKTDEAKAVEDAKNDVKEHIHSIRWFMGGCMFSVVGLILAQREPKKIPVARLIGKTKEYVTFYTDTYRIEMRKKRYNYALGGCLLNGITLGGIATAIVFNRYEF